MVAMKKKPDYTDDALGEIEASFACEGIFFTDEEKALMRQMDDENLPTEERIARLQAYFRNTIARMPKADQ